jgi:integrase
MSSHWWPNKIRQFVRYMSGRVTAAEHEELGIWLTAPQLALFQGMHRADQRHGLDVVDALRRSGHSNPDLLVAGLLHDAGKGRNVRVWHRVAWSLSERYGSGEAGLLARFHGFRHAFATLAQHAQRSAEMALAAGCTPLTAELIRHQAEPTDSELGTALLLADEAS